MAPTQTWLALHGGHRGPSWASSSVGADVDGAAANSAAYAEGGIGDKALPVLASPSTATGHQTRWSEMSHP